MTERNRRMLGKIDLHTHSCESDGTETPAELVRLAAAAGIDLLALTDHDGVRGVMKARQEADKQGITLIPAVEISTEYSEELHILGLDIDFRNAAFCEALALVDHARWERNERMLEQLTALGMDVRAWMPEDIGTVTRMHIALALRAGGFVKTTKEAFERYLSKGKPGYASTMRYTPEKAIELIISAGGVPVLAHPCLLKRSAHTVIRELTEYGLQGVEAYYSSASEGQIKEHCSIAKQMGLLITCGSDFHGKNRPKAMLGCAWRSVKELEQMREFFLERMQNRHDFQS